MATTTLELLRREEVQARCAISRSSLYELLKAGRFPKPVRLSPSRIAWVASEVDAWIQARIAERDHV